MQNLRASYLRFLLLISFLTDIIAVSIGRIFCLSIAILEKNYKKVIDNIR